MATYINPNAPHGTPYVTADGQHYFNGGTFDQQNQFLDPVNALIKSGQYRDIPGSIMQQLLTQQISLEQAMSMIQGTPLFNPSTGPQVNYGQGNVPFAGSFNPPAQSPPAGNQVLGSSTSASPMATIPQPNLQNPQPILNVQNLPNLGPGSTGNDVKTLQTWLVANGYLTQSQMDTGPGIYGPATTAAVAKWQAQNNIDTQGNPGYFGPISKSFLNKQAQSSSPSSGGSSGATSSGGTTGGVSLNYDPSLSKYGISESVWNSMTNDQKGLLSVIFDVSKSLYSTTGAGVTLQQALDAASKDPTITAKYADALKMDQTQFQQSIQDLQTQLSQTSQDQATQFRNERLSLANNAAQAGQAFSGFRNQAQKDLLTSESGIINSTRSQILKQLRDQTSAFEAKYGSAATTPASITYMNPFAAGGYDIGGTYSGAGSSAENLSASLVGGITGSQPVAQKQDVLNLATNYYNLGQTPQL